jgi:hypothetical protein
MTPMKSLRLFFAVLPIAVLLTALKMAVHLLGLEFIAFNALVPSLIAGAIFIIGFLLAQLLTDYKEAERMPGEFRSALEAIYDETRVFAQKVPATDLNGMRRILSDIVTALEDCLRSTGGTCDMNPAIRRVGDLTDAFAELERLGFSERYLVRLKYAQDILRRSLFRTFYVQKMQFVPSAHVLGQTLIYGSLLLLLMMRTEQALEPALVFGFVSYLFVYVLLLVRSLEQPFRKGRNSVDDVSLFLLRDFREKISQP